jgi:hypothetical protein
LNATVTHAYNLGTEAAMRTVPLSVLDSVRIAAPCPVAWESMTGDARVRHCDQCNLKVFNISDMTRDEADAFLRDAAGIRAAGGRVCAGFWRRGDGTILLKDCPVGLAKVRAALARKMSRIAAALALLVGAGAAVGGKSEETRLKWREPFSAIARALNPVAPFLGPMVRPQQRWLAGSIMIAPPPPLQINGSQQNGGQ